MPRNLFALTLAGVIVALSVLLMPSDAARISEPTAWVGAPFELFWGLALLCVLPREMARRASAAVAALLVVLLAWKLADIFARTAYWRTFDPLADWRLLAPGWNVLTQSIGTGWSLAVLGALILLLAVVGWLSAAGLYLASRLGHRNRLRTAALLGAVGAVCLGGGVIDQEIGERSASRFVAEHVELSRHNLEALASLKTELGKDALASMPSNRLMTQIKGQDVLLLFVESYGRSALEAPEYSGVVRARLEAIERSLGSAGYEAYSGWLESPTVGGQSWLAHATLLSGLWIDSQRRYEWLVESPRLTLNRLFQRGGWRTVAAMPANTRPWDEASFFGYDTVYDASNLGYEGKPFNWVTMPDQFTLWSLYQRELAVTRSQPVMIEAALISSHAPWTPIPTLKAWDHLDQGRAFDQEADSGDPPRVVWQDPDRVRRQYLKSIDYTLKTLGSFVTEFQKTRPIVVAVGDHQPASIITGNEATRQVPMHIMAPTGNSMLLLAKRWGWTQGMIPEARLLPMTMAAVRDRLVMGLQPPGR
ncbi:sulfatase-like hydrolase/transferase [Larsenimonas suaedae]|uniref:Sulfatase N-terminal domain-containing protein n=1 Tax=Larsenimonas suaedae TaxID=1851019 RepID=A0ABU1GW97_9GAMM|nr:sulfatase-like hydrolase/transferase [Larsenimonas suaedae]MCM2973432.1 hypothetical protein [Larsenimonas suaedae]MDR5896325.1 hypothetical protein [Larsenimonas suaedae]